MKKKNNVLKISPRYIVNEFGKVTDVVLDIATFEQLFERLEDLYYFGSKAEEALKDKEFIDFEEANKDTLRKK